MKRVVSAVLVFWIAVCTSLSLTVMQAGPALAADYSGDNPLQACNPLNLLGGTPAIGGSAMITGTAVTGGEATSVAGTAAAGAATIDAVALLGAGYAGCVAGYSGAKWLYSLRPGSSRSFEAVYWLSDPSGRVIKMSWPQYKYDGTNCSFAGASIWTPGSAAEPDWPLPAVGNNVSSVTPTNAGCVTLQSSGGVSTSFNWSCIVGNCSSTVPYYNQSPYTNFWGGFHVVGFRTIIGLGSFNGLMATAGKAGTLGQDWWAPGVNMTSCPSTGDTLTLLSCGWQIDTTYKYLDCTVYAPTGGCALDVEAKPLDDMADTNYHSCRNPGYSGYCDGFDPDHDTTTVLNPYEDARIRCKWGGYVVHLRDCAIYEHAWPGAHDEMTDDDPDPSPTPTVTITEGGGGGDGLPEEGTNPVIPDDNPDDDSESCLQEGWTWNPISWVYTPVKCVLQWAFVPPESSLESFGNSLGDLGDTLPFGFIIDVGDMAESLRTVTCGSYSACWPDLHWHGTAIAPYDAWVFEYMRDHRALYGGIFYGVAVLGLGIRIFWAVIPIVGGGGKGSGDTT